MTGWQGARMARIAAAALALALGGSACLAGGGSASGLTGEVAADGSSTVFPITQAIAEEFGRDARNVKVTVGTSGTGGGFKKFCKGEIDIADASRPIKKAEKDICAKAGIEFLELRVALDGLSILVNPENDFATCLTVAELKRIWEPKSKVDDWSQVRAGFPNRPLKGHLYGPGTDSGTFDYFTDEIVGEEGASRSDYIASEDDNVLVTGIAGDDHALGYFGFAFYEENRTKLKLVEVDGGDGCVAPTAETINNGTYKPLSRPLFVYVAKAAVSEPQVVAFMDFYLDNASGLVADVGYVPLAAADLAAEKAKWAAFKGVALPAGTASPMGTATP